MSFDPFADEQPTVAPSTPAPATETATVAQPQQSDISEKRGEVVVTLKGDGQAPWIVVHAATPAEAAQQMREPSFKDLMQLSQGATTYYSGQSAQQAPIAPPQQGQQPQGQSPQQNTPPHQQAPSGETRQCPHGQMQYKSGFSQKTGKNWYAFDCPQNVCNRQWIN